VRRIVRIVIYNWPLKLAAIVLASLLYGGLVLSQSTRTYRDPIPIGRVNVSTDLYVVSDLGDVTSIQYVAPVDLRVDANTFHAAVDFASADPGAGSVSLPVRLTTSDPGIQIIDFEPKRISVTVDRVTSRDVPVHVEILSSPPGFQLGTPLTDASTVTVTGPQAVVSQVAQVVARVTIDPSGIDVDRTVDLVPVDGNGNTLSPVDVEPSATRVKVAVFTDRRTRTLPVNPVVTGTPAAGFEVASIIVNPLVVSVEGDANDLSGLDRADSQPISISGASSDVVVSVGLSLPNGVQALGSGTVGVTIQLRPVTATRTFEAGLVLEGASPDREYAISTDRVLVTIGGSVADLDRLSASNLVLTLDVTGLGDGAHKLAPQANLTTGLTLITVSPTTVTVTITTPPPSPAPSP
jgi:YbbR domain-containing protein